MTHFENQNNCVKREYQDHRLKLGHQLSAPLHGLRPLSCLRKYPTRVFLQLSIGVRVQAEAVGGGQGKRARSAREWASDPWSERPSVEQLRPQWRRGRGALVRLLTKRKKTRFASTSLCSIASLHASPRFTSNPAALELDAFKSNISPSHTWQLSNPSR